MPAFLPEVGDEVADSENPLSATSRVVRPSRAAITGGHEARGAPATAFHAPSAGFAPRKILFGRISPFGGGRSHRSPSIPRKRVGRAVLRSARCDRIGASSRAVSEPARYALSGWR